MNKKGVVLAEAFTDLWCHYWPLRSILQRLKLRWSKPVKENTSRILNAVKERKKKKEDDSYPSLHTVKCGIWSLGHSEKRCAGCSISGLTLSLPVGLIDTGLNVELLAARSMSVQDYNNKEPIVAGRTELWQHRS